MIEHTLEICGLFIKITLPFRLSEGDMIDDELIYNNLNVHHHEKLKDEQLADKFAKATGTLGCFVESCFIDHAGRLYVQVNANEGICHYINLDKLSTIKVYFDNEPNKGDWIDASLVRLYVPDNEEKIFDDYYGSRTAFEVFRKTIALGPVINLTLI